MDKPPIYKIMDNLYTNKSSKWIKEYEDNDISPFLIQKFLIMNDNIRLLVRWLDKYVFKLPAKMYLSLAWSIIPKSPKAPFIKYIKETEEEEEFDFILKKVRHHMEMGDNDFNACKHRILSMIKSDMISWFSFYGIGKKHWKKYYLDFDKMRGEPIVEKQPIGLGAWGI